MAADHSAPVSGDSNVGRAFEQSMRMVGDLQMALRLVRELLDDGAGNAAQLAERLTEKAEDGEVYSEEWVEAGLAELDQWALLDVHSLEDDAPVDLWRP